MKVFCLLWLWGIPFLSLDHGQRSSSFASAFSVMTTKGSTRTLGGRIKRGTPTTLLLEASSNDSNNNMDDNVSSPSPPFSAVDASNLKATAAAMRQWSPQDLERMIQEVKTMSPQQAAQFREMGMDPDVMKETMTMMRDNPQMRDQMAQVMENTTPEQLLEQSKQAQEQIKQQQQQQQQQGDVKANDEDENTDIDNEDEDEDDEDDEPIETDPAVLDAMYQVAEYMSEPSERGGITLAAFETLPPISVLSGNKDDDDLTPAELRECWEDASLGATRVDRNGFARVWQAVQDRYYNDIVEEARERMSIKKRKRRRGSTDKPSATPAAAATTTSTTTNTSTMPDPATVSEQIKNLKDDDFNAMLEQMAQMKPEDEARMKAMGVDPAMMRKSADMMRNNPLLRKAATAMMKNTSPEQLAEANRKAQEKMANMTPEERQKLLDSMK